MTPYGSLTVVNFRQKSCGQTYAHKLEYKGRSEEFMGKAYIPKQGHKGQANEHSGKTYNRKEGCKH